MEKKYENGERVYLEVTVNEVNPGNGYDYTVLWKDHVDGAMCMASVGEENLCSMESGIDWQGAFNEYSEKAQRKIEALTKQLEEANETIKAFSESEDIVRTNFDAKVDENKELKARNAELEALLKEVMATRDEAIKQNNELVAENKKLKVENDEWQKTARCYSYNAIGDLELTRKLRAEIKGLKAERDDLASQLGKNLAEIQNLSSEVHFLKAQKEVKKPVHVFTNDGTEVEFRRYTDVTYRTDYNILVIKDGEEIVAGFIRGDRPGNLAYWWTE